jgi:hypothetical protein
MTSSWSFSAGKPRAIVVAYWLAVAGDEPINREKAAWASVEISLVAGGAGVDDGSTTTGVLHGSVGVASQTTCNRERSCPRMMVIMSPGWFEVAMILAPSGRA